MSVENPKIRAAEILQGILSLTNWRPLLSNEYLCILINFCKAVLNEDAFAQTDTSSALFSKLLSQNRPLSLSEALFEELLFTDTPLSLKAGSCDFRVIAAAVRDLEILHDILDKLQAFFLQMVYPGCDTCCLEPDLFKFFIGGEMDKLVATLEVYYLRNGSGIFARYKGFVLRGNELIGVKPDPVTFSHLIGYRRERELIVENTLSLIEGRPANNILLYGDRGTGKSTTVKALLNEFGDRGLRMIQLTCDQLFSLPDLINTLENRRNVFILFIDDLSFSSESAGYTALKSILEGGLSAKPSNVAIYATSNRRHLIGQQFSQRNDDVHSEDTLQEKLSLADRFGITVTFSTPSQEQYIEIVFGLLEQRGLEFEREKVRAEAIRWEMRQNGLSPRTARQFADWMEPRLKPQNAPKN